MLAVMLVSCMSRGWDAALRAARLCCLGCGKIREALIWNAEDFEALAVNSHRPRGRWEVGGM